ncbi:restriction endonuclease subunit R [Rubrivivax gelatinosus]|uniref:type I restriction endonuclease subunit R n=1 Tax=Rubrivivax gelatinosus TaxID=28068 RepID=UPI0019084C8A|nr:type I restriction endonuclease [Rubrivivax gelatinosus]MBK1614532.1 restriction endonuclease subunit R [Rubrivivax gelatinosus]MBZ8142939.1 restriction endonuclease subunit R [Rubrivivax gelatinosus]
MHKEIDFENDIEHALVTQGGYEKGDPNAYDTEAALFPAEVVAFVEKTQPKIWTRLTQLDAAKAPAMLLDSLVKELATKGALAILREGFKCVGKTVRLAYFAPNTGLDPASTERYGDNRLTVVRQVNTKSGAIPDVVLAVNGLPVATLELKNPMSATRWNVEHAKHQYRFERDPKELLFAFKQRCLVHFAVDTELVFMTTKLEGKDTFFLPFNLGHHHAAGNPPVMDGDGGDVRTAYLWRQVLARDSLMDILARFIHLDVEEKTVVTEKGIKRHRKETMIFPRYHQLDAVRALTSHAQAHGSGHNYLIQHSAGSGKSNSIAWLAHRLSSLHNAVNEKIFHSVVVITDRRVLDQQLQDTIFQFEHKLGVVQKIDENTQQLAKALADGVPIIISTIQKFPFITQAIRTMEANGKGVAISTAGKRFAVIVDEAHSSQSGETAMELRKILNKDGIEAAIAEQLLDLDDEALSEDAKKELLRSQLKRAKQPNLSFFAFTATPKFKTLAVFNEPGPNGKAPFHHYSMRQAIEEGFIHDVLEYYTHYKRYYKLIQKVEEDPEVPRRKAAKALARFVQFHDYEIAQKVEVIVEHFRTHTRHKIGGRAKAMVVTNSREHAVRYKLGFDKYIKDKGYTDVKSLVAFSGEITLKEFADKKFTEVGMNDGIKESELPEKFNTEEYQVLLVAEKYQTGFDQPLLHSMYVDKRLSGIQAVQTLSRLNRTTRGKTDTFVLDFVNEPEEIYAAFKPYYEATKKGEDTDPQQLNKLAHTLAGWKVYTADEVSAWCEIWFRNRMNPTGGEHKKLNALLDLAVERFKGLGEEDQNLFKGQLASFRNLYAFVSQVVPYQDSDHEKLFTYARFLLTKLPHTVDSRKVQVDDEVELKYYRLQKISEGAIDLKAGEPEALYGPTEVGTGQADEDVQLSTLVGKLNERFGTEFTPADQLFFDQVRETAVANEQLRQAVMANSIENFEPVFNKQLENLFIERMDGNEDIFVRLMNDEAFRSVAASHLMRAVYQQVKASGK